jgi:hypothetical protein
MDRRRLASLLAIVLSGGATLATSAPVPTPAAHLKHALDGTATLSPEAPVAVQEFHVRVSGPKVFAIQSPTVNFAWSAKPQGGNAADVRLRIVKAGPNSASNSTDAFRVLGPVFEASPAYRLACTGDVCEQRFAAIVEWTDPASSESATVDWHVDADIGVFDGGAAGSATADVTTETIDVVEPPALTVAQATGEAVRLDARNRVAQWRVTFRLGPGELATAPAWPLIATARLVPNSTVVTPPDEGDPTVAFPFVDGLGELSSVTVAANALNGAIEFEPFVLCTAGNACTADYIVGMNWPDSRVESVSDAGWDLDVRVIGADGRSVPVEVSVEPVPPMPIAVGTTSGQLTWTKGVRDEFRYEITVPRGSGESKWDGARVPLYGIWHATMTSTGSAPIDPGFGVNFGRYGSERRIRIEDGELTYGFPFDQGYACRVGAEQPCVISRDLAAGFSGDNLPNGWQFTVTWDLEIGVGTTDPDGGTIDIVDVTPTPTPVP